MRLSFALWMLKEELGWGMSREGEKAVGELMAYYHGKPEEEIKADLLSPKIAKWLERKLGAHGGIYEVIQKVAGQFGIEIPAMKA